MGKTVGNIAVELTLSVKTVSTYRVRALHKLGMLTNADLMRYAIGHPLDESTNPVSDAVKAPLHPQAIE
jgi:DNA-binding NarL/FixJ family response regulator